MSEQVKPASEQKPVVKLAEMSESNGRVTWCVFLAKNENDYLWDCHQVYSDTIKGRAEYEVAALRHFLGQGEEPNILAFDTDPPTDPAPQPDYKAQRDALLKSVAQVKSNLMHHRRFGDDTFQAWKNSAARAEGDLEEAIASVKGGQ